MKGLLAAASVALLVSASSAEAASHRPGRSGRQRKAPVVRELLEAPPFTSILEVTGGPETDLRDALAPAAPAQGPAPAAAQAASPAAPGSPILLERLVAEHNASPRRIDAASCSWSARNLRFIVNVAKTDLRGTAAPVARKKFASGLKRELEALRRSPQHEDSEVAVLATQAEMELEAALQELERRPLRSDSLATASRAAADLDAAARLIAQGEGR